jgi:uncharacterized protein with HEPN domain
MDRQAFERDGKTRDAVERCLERICEAAHRLGGRAAQLMPNQPWSDIRGMGNRLRHAYDRLDLGDLLPRLRRMRDTRWCNCGAQPTNKTLHPPAARWPNAYWWPA